MVGESLRVFGAAVTVAAVLAGTGGVAAAQPDGPRPDVGGYPTTPGPPLGAAGSPQAGAAIEGQRMADFVVGPWEVDPALTFLYADSAVVFDGADAMNGEMPADLIDVARRHRVIDGFSSYREATAHDLRVAVLRFADPQTAQAATTEFADVAGHRGDADGPVSPAAVPGHPETAAFANPSDDAQRGQQVTYVRAFTAHGPYVFYQLAVSASGVDDAVALVAGALDRQAPLIDQFVLTPEPLLATLPSDSTGLKARTVPPPPAEVSATRPGVYSPRGTLHFQSDPVASARRFADHGVTNWSYGAAGVYETRDPQAARRLVDDFTEEAASLGTPTGPIAGVPGSVCMNLRFEKTGDENVYCLAAADRYAIESDGDTLLDAQQRTAAQYLLLTGR